MIAYCTQNTDRECRETDCCLNKTAWQKLEESREKLLLPIVQHCIKILEGKEI